MISILQPSTPSTWYIFMMEIQCRFAKKKRKKKKTNKNFQLRPHCNQDLSQSSFESKEKFVIPVGLFLMDHKGILDPSGNWQELGNFRFSIPFDGTFIDIRHLFFSRGSISRLWSSTSSSSQLPLMQFQGCIFLSRFWFFSPLPLIFFLTTRRVAWLSSPYSNKTM